MKWINLFPPFKDTTPFVENGFQRKGGHLDTMAQKEDAPPEPIRCYNYEDLLHYQEIRRRTERLYMGPLRERRMIKTRDPLTQATISIFAKSTP